MGSPRTWTPSVTAAEQAWTCSWRPRAGSPSPPNRARSHERPNGHVTWGNLCHALPSGTAVRSAAHSCPGSLRTRPKPRPCGRRRTEPAMPSAVFAARAGGRWKRPSGSLCLCRPCVPTLGTPGAPGLPQPAARSPRPPPPPPLPGQRGALPLPVGAGGGGERRGAMTPSSRAFPAAP